MKTKHIISYNPKLKKLAQEMRKAGTLAEVLLWQYLKGKQMSGYDFDRQKPIDNYIVDFYCKDLMLAIEIDGDTHNYKADMDEERQNKLERLGVRFLRFTDDEVKQNIDGVVMAIDRWVKEKGEPTPAPLQGGDL